MKIKLCLLMLISWQWIGNGISAETGYPLALKDCNDTCGNVKIPYPFGIGNSSCATNRNFFLNCSNDRPLLFESLPVVNISLLQGTVTVEVEIAFECNKKPTNCGMIFYDEIICRKKQNTSGIIFYDWINLTGSSFMRSNKSNQLLVLDWAVEDTCEGAQPNRCSNNSWNRTNGSGHKCLCREGFMGNPYLPDGCQDIDECKEPDKYRCDGRCKNVHGNYTRHCPFGMDGDGKGGCRGHHAATIALGIGLGFGFLLALSGLFGLYVIHEQSKIKLKRKFFRRNGGLLLQQQISSDKGKLEKIKIFTSEELERATDHYNDNRILGQGAQGTVYKAMLRDGSIVAVKKSEMMDQGQAEHFINEVVILSQINHRHVVQLLGCCLETEVPLLVYEFVSSGTLSDHIHGQLEESPMKWADRLRIAKEVAGAIAYMHSAAAVPIYHRDIKSSNILLDEKYRAKLSDFGISRSVPTGKTHLTTSVQGTFGYLDPEYFQSNQCTAKSDVYSFGVVLAELLTGQRPISMVRSEDNMGLAAHFISSIKENHLLEVLDPQVVMEGGKEEILIVSNLALRCLKLNGRKRPTMKEVALQLENLKERRENLLLDQEHQEGDYSVMEPERGFDIVAAPVMVGRGNKLELGIRSY